MGARVRMQALELLTRLQAISSEHIGKIVRLLDDSNPKICQSALVALGEKELTSVFEFVNKMLNDLGQPDEQVRKHALRILVELDWAERPNHTGKLADCLRDPRPLVRRNALEVIGRGMDRVSASPYLDKIAEMLNDIDLDVRLRALDVLGEKAMKSAYVTEI